MRTKALLLAAALTAAGIASIQAQSNVYSVNVVGYVNVTVPANGFAMIANPLNSTNNTLGSLLPTVPANTLFYKYDGGYTTYLFDEFDSVWTPNANATLAPGEGGFLRNVTGTPMTITFVGEVLQGQQTTAVPAGYAILSSKIPQSGLITTDLAFPAVANDLVYTYAGGYTTYLFDEFDAVWTPSQPTINVGQAFFSFKGAGASWVRNFTIP